MTKRFLPFLMMILISASMNSQTQEFEEGVDFKIVDTVPVAKGCNENWNNEALRTCFTKYVTNIVVQNISNSFLQNQDLEPGLHKVNLIFSIDKRGRVSDVKTDADNKKVDKHFRKALRSVRRMKPGRLNGEAVKIQYALPIKFKIG